MLHEAEFLQPDAKGNANRFRARQQRRFGTVVARLIGRFSNALLPLGQ
jgi:hypothetical protein